jgi:hypothetical protein
VDLAPLEEALAQNLDDPRFWAVYADALAEAQPGSPRALAVQKALAEGSRTPGVPYEPQQIEVDWHYGHWRAVRVLGSLPLRRVIEHVHARFLLHLVLRSSEQLDLAHARLPRTLERLDIEEAGQWDDMVLLGPLGAQLRELRMPELLLGELSGAPALLRLQLRTLEAWRGPLPLRHLSLEAAALPRLLELDPAAVPALDTLTVRWDILSEDLLELLSSPLGRQLRRLEVRGDDLAEYAAQQPELWAHLELLTVDGSGDNAPAMPRLRGRQPMEVEPEPQRSFCLRMPPPITALGVVRAVEAAGEALGLSMELRREGADVGLLLGQAVVFPLARMLAARERTPVQVIQGFLATDFTPEGLVRRGTLGASPWTRPVSSAVLAISEYDLERSELEADLHVVEEDDHSQDDYDSGSEEDWETEPEFEGSQPSVWVPVDWQPDPLAYAPSLPHFPRSLLPVSLASGQPEGDPLPLEDSLGSYVCWRAFAACLLEEVPLPDIERWTARMLRRYRLEQEPNEHNHAYWHDWRRVSLQERSMPASPGRVPAYKLSSPGRWILDGPECRLLASALRQRIPHHTPPTEHNSGLTLLTELLAAGRALEVWVR